MIINIMIEVLFFLFFLYKLSKYIFFRKHFEHKCVLITGGAGALGTHLARRFLKYKDTKVILIDINKERLDNLKKELPGIITITCDIGNYEELKLTMKKVKSG